MLKIDRVTVYMIVKPLAHPLRNASFQMDSIIHNCVEIEADGLKGIGEVVCFDARQSEAYHAYLGSSAKLLLGEDAEMLRRLWKLMFKKMSGVGQSGFAMQALGAVDEALWDLNARALGVPVWRMLGAARDRIEVYASGGWIGTDDELVEEALSSRAHGYRRYKMKLGCADWRDDIRRVRKVQEACGPEMEIMVDVNQGWDVKKCVRIAPALEEMGITHFEEPVKAHDYDGQRFVRDHVGMNVVAGEKLYGLAETSELLLRKCVDKMNPDIGRCGGVSGFMEVAAVADICNIPVSSHAYSAHSIPCLAAAPTGDLAERIPIWEDGLYDGEPVIENGWHRLTDRPGFGVTLSARAAEEWCTAKTVHG